MVIGYELHPGTLYLNVTNRCSNDCTFCVRRRAGFSLGGYAMKLDREPTASEVLGDVARLEREHGRPFDEVVFCGFGEPTMRLELVSEVGRALRAAGSPVRLDTNGQAALIAGRDPMPLLAGALDALSVSLNAPDAASYAELCRPRFGAAAYPAVLDFARAATERFARVTLTVVGCALDERAVTRSAEIAAAMGADFRVR
jgi:TatD family-associated radical SAM protein